MACSGSLKISTSANTAPISLANRWPWIVEIGDMFRSDNLWRIDGSFLRSIFVPSSSIGGEDDEEDGDEERGEVLGDDEEDEEGADKGEEKWRCIRGYHFSEIDRKEVGLITE